MAGNLNTPAMRQWAAFKKKHPDCVLLFRMGDFYELFDEDAVRVSKAIGLTLTQRTEGLPMAGMPHHQLDTYLKRLIDRGFRVAVCDQVQDPREAKGVVERAVTRVLTPGTLVEESLLADDATNRLAAVAFLGSGDDPQQRVGVAVVEVSTGAFAVFDTTAADLPGELARRSPSELLYADTSGNAPPPRIDRILSALSLSGTPRPAWHFRPQESLEALHAHYGVASLAGFGIREDDCALGPAGAIVRYLRETQVVHEDDAELTDDARRIFAGRSLAHLTPPRREDPSRNLRLDAASLRALEIERTVRASGNATGSRNGDSDGSLLSIFARPGCCTPMGRRLIREWLCAPLCDLAAIEARHHAVGTLTSDPMLARALTDALDPVQDVARIMARIGLARATPRDLVALGRSLGRIDAIAQAIEGAPAFEHHRNALVECRAALAPISERIARECIDDPPAHLRDGGIIRDGIDPALDEARQLQRDSGAWLAEYQTRLIAEHELPSLKVGYNKVFGYYIELPSAQARRAPDIFTRKQTLKNAERYITPELKQYEDKVLGAGERAVQREQDLFANLCRIAAEGMRDAAAFSEVVAELDVLACFADRAVRRNWIKPEMTDEPILDITQGRHPVLEDILTDRFVPNDCALAIPADDATPTLALITGPNMAGKSTYIRQVALLVLLAHAGSFVPAEAARIGITDRIFTRIGADDALHQGQSTFMVEMVETANILHNATTRSLVVLDEIGRGTSTLDGLSLAWAIAEHLAAETGAHPRTLFATHYHEITDLAEQTRGRVTNLHVSVREWGDEIVFLHRILPGRANQSYGIHVARLAGLPRSVVQRANQLLESLNVSHTGAAAPVHAPPRQRDAQLGLFAEPAPHPAIEEIKAIEIERITPLEAFDRLRNLSTLVRNNSQRSDAPREPK